MAATGTAAPQPVAPRTPPTATVPTPAPAVVPQKVELPSSNADYLHNPEPVYPPMSKRRNEQGRVVIRVLVGADGTAQKAEVKVSSGFERLDKAALETVLGRRYVPGTRGGVPEAMWLDAPFEFKLKDER